MSRLFKLKEWLTLDEAAQHISTAIDENVEIKDLLRLALDKHLTLSVNFVNHAQARKGELVGPEDVKIAGKLAPWFAEAIEKIAIEHGNDPAIAHQEIVLSLGVEEGLFLNLDKKVSSIDGIWDLPLWGNEHLDIQHKYQQLIGGPEVTLVCIEGTYVRRGNIACEVQESWEENEYQKGSEAQKKDIENFILRESVSSEKAEKLRGEYKVWRKEFLEKQKNRPKEENYYPAGKLPDDAALVVRTDEVLRFLNELDSIDTSKSAEIGSRERNTLLVLLAALCKEAKIDHTERGIASAIELLTHQIGATVSDDTIRKILKQIPNALESRQK